ncbi:Nif3-like dinuclear metal center hexameric protein [Inediibacterium massiliense]|uniref:Nif3-like dinuclear metal center hexameric protein n=1 Tax=Inediibacterium massiliense TaxID=1658111 RepID=UPI0006B4C6EC|nr:Nif3-like dinuclear metal center hexameric protein [Inediibacterium massiliense]
MAEKIKNIIRIMEDIAPSYLAESWDNIGLQIGDYEKEVNKILVCLEVTQSIIDEGIQKNIDMIVCHHPLIFKPIKRIRRDDPIQSMIHKLIKHDISLYCAHTNLDVAKGGTSDVLAQSLNLVGVVPLVKTHEEKYLKLVVYVPKDYVEKVGEVMCTYGAGHVGNYSHCTFRSEGIGTFMPLGGTNPFIGSQGNIEKVCEHRLESIVSKKDLHKIIENMIKAHPYEEVAYDIIPLENKIHYEGLGRVGQLEKNMTLSMLCKTIKEKLNMKTIKFIGNPQKEIKKVGLCTGSGAEFIDDAYKVSCDCYITGDVKYHDAQYANELGMAVIDAGHFETENIICRPLFETLKDHMQMNQYNVEILLSDEDINPFKTI